VDVVLLMSENEMCGDPKSGCKMPRYVHTCTKQNAAREQ